MSSPPILYSSVDGGAWQGGYQLAYKSQIPTVTNYYWANVIVSATSSTSTSPTFANMKSTGRVYLDEWIQFSGSSGLLWPNANGAHLQANTTTSYAGLMTQGARSGYCGLHCGPNTNYMTVMSTDVHHGLYCENTGTWVFYYNRSSGGVGIRTSSITKNFNVSGQSYLSSNTWIGTTSGSEMLNVGGWVGTVGNTGWCSVTHGGGWHMTDSTWIRNYNNKPMYYSINTHNVYGTGGHRLAACFYGSSHVSILLLNSSNGWGLNSNSDGNFYFGFRNQCHASDTSKDSYPSYLTKAGYWYAAHYYENSDQRLKENIKAILDRDNMPIIKEFDWIESGEHSYGLIAQELEEQGYSELVSTKDDGFKTVNYSAALSLIVGKLQVKIKELEKEIEILKNKN